MLSNPLISQAIWLLSIPEEAARAHGQHVRGRVSIGNPQLPDGAGYITHERLAAAKVAHCLLNSRHVAEAIVFAKHATHRLASSASSDQQTVSWSSLAFSESLQECQQDVLPALSLFQRVCRSGSDSAADAVAAQCGVAACHLLLSISHADPQDAASSALDAVGCLLEVLLTAHSDAYLPDASFGQPHALSPALRDLSPHAEPCQECLLRLLDFALLCLQRGAQSRSDACRREAGALLQALRSAANEVTKSLEGASHEPIGAEGAMSGLFSAAVSKAAAALEQGLGSATATAADGGPPAPSATAATTAAATRLRAALEAAQRPLVQELLRRGLQLPAAEVPPGPGSRAYSGGGVSTTGSLSSISSGSLRVSAPFLRSSSGGSSGGSLTTGEGGREGCSSGGGGGSGGSGCGEFAAGRITMTSLAQGRRLSASEDAAVARPLSPPATVCGGDGSGGLAAAAGGLGRLVRPLADYSSLPMPMGLTPPVLTSLASPQHQGLMSPAATRALCHPLPGDTFPAPLPDPGAANINAGRNADTAVADAAATSVGSPPSGCRPYAAPAASIPSLHPGVAALRPELLLASLSSPLPPAGPQSDPSPSPSALRHTGPPPPPRSSPNSAPRRQMQYGTEEDGVVQTTPATAAVAAATSVWSAGTGTAAAAELATATARRVDVDENSGGGAEGGGHTGSGGSGAAAAAAEAVGFDSHFGRGTGGPFHIQIQPRRPVAATAVGRSPPPQQQKPEQPAVAMVESAAAAVAGAVEAAEVAVAAVTAVRSAVLNATAGRGGLIPGASPLPRSYGPSPERTAAAAAGECGERPTQSQQGGGGRRIAMASSTTAAAAAGAATAGAAAAGTRGHGTDGAAASQPHQPHELPLDTPFLRGGMYGNGRALNGSSGRSSSSSLGSAGPGAALPTATTAPAAPGANGWAANLTAAVRAAACRTTSSNSSSLDLLTTAQRHYSPHSAVRSKQCYGLQPHPSTAAAVNASTGAAVAASSRVARGPSKTSATSNEAPGSRRDSGTLKAASGGAAVAASWQDPGDFHSAHVHDGHTRARARSHASAGIGVAVSHVSRLPVSELRSQKDPWLAVSDSVLLPAAPSWQQAAAAAAAAGAAAAAAGAWRPGSGCGDAAASRGSISATRPLQSLSSAASAAAVFLKAAAEAVRPVGVTTASASASASASPAVAGPAAAAPPPAQRPLSSRSSGAR